MESTKIYNLVILDESGSMGSVRRESVSGCNETIQTIRSAQKEHSEQQQFLSIMMFDGTSEVNLRYFVKNEKVDNVYDLTENDYRPNGNTPLFDAIGISVNELHEKIKEETNTIGVVTIITDGYENASREYSLYDIQQLINLLKSEGWVFSFIGADIDAMKTAASLNIESSLQFEKSREGMSRMFERERRSRASLYDNMASVNDGRFSEEERRAEYRKMNAGYFERGLHISPNFISSLRSNEVFVFGSNIDGNHNGGAALLALRKFGATMGQAEGLQGRSYAIPSDGSNMHDFSEAVFRFIRFAEKHPEMRFLVTRIGCGSAGYTDEQVAPLFEAAKNIDNIYLPESFWNILGSTVTSKSKNI